MLTPWRYTQQHCTHKTRLSGVWSVSACTSTACITACTSGHPGQSVVPWHRIGVSAFGDDSPAALAPLTPPFKCFPAGAPAVERSPARVLQAEHMKVPSGMCSVAQYACNSPSSVYSSNPSGEKSSDMSEKGSLEIEVYPVRPSDYHICYRKDGMPTTGGRVPELQSHTTRWHNETASVKSQSSRFSVLYHSDHRLRCSEADLRDEWRNTHARCVTMQVMGSLLRMAVSSAVPVLH